MEVVRYSLYFSSEAAARSAAAVLRLRDGDVEVAHSPSNEWRLRVTRAVTSEQTIDEHEAALERLAMEHGGEYDGYER
jgi:hypothetical protein